MSNKITTEQLVRAALAQHQHWLYRSSSAVSSEAAAIVRQLGADVASSIYDNLPELSDAEKQSLLSGRYTTRGLRDFRSSLNKALSGFGGSLGELLERTGVELAGYESSYAARLLGAVVKDINDPKLDPTGVYAEAKRQPVLGKIYDEWLQEIEDDARKRVFQNIRTGVANGSSTDEISRGIRGSKASGYTDGVLNVSKREADAIVRTTRTHVSNVAYEQTYAALGVKYLIVCATLDGRTSFYCASHDGTRYKLGTKFPRPPYHYHCRTVMMPDTDDDGFEKRTANTSFKSIGKMSDDEKDSVDYTIEDGKNYKQWFAGQSDAFQRRWLGATRYDLYKSGKYSIDRFTDEYGRVYTIEELREADEKTFSDLGL